MATSVQPVAAPAPSPVPTTVTPAPAAPAPQAPTTIVVPPKGPPLSAAERAVYSDDESFAEQYGIADIVLPPKGAAAEAPTLEAAVEQAGEEGVEGFSAPPGWTQDDQGRWHSADGKFAPLKSAESANAEIFPHPENEKQAAVPIEPEIPAPAPVAAPAAPAAEPEKPPVQTDPATPPPALATEFRMVQGGEEVEIPRDVLLSFKANGLEYRDIPLDLVVRAAQRGYSNETREQQLELRESKVQDVLRNAEEFKARAEFMEREYDKVFNDEDYYFRAQEAYREQQKPEAQVERLKQQLAQKEIETRQFQERQRDEGFFNYVAPRLESFATSHPLVTSEEVWNQFARLTQPAMRQGRIAPEHFQAVAQLVDGALADYVASLNDSRKYAKITEEKAQAELQKQKGQVILAKRQAAKAMAPTPAPAPKGGQEPQRKIPAKSARAEDVNEAILKNAIAAGLAPRQ